MKLFMLLPLMALSVTVAIARVGAHDQAQLDPRITTTAPVPVQCRYEIIVQTGDVGYAGTDSIITLRLYGWYGNMLSITNLASWGKNGPGYNYFERGNADVFSGTGACLIPKPCIMILESDNSGNKPGWYVDYVMVTEFMPDSSQVSQMFMVNQWLAKDESPYKLSAYRVDC